MNIRNFYKELKNNLTPMIIWQINNPNNYQYYDFFLYICFQKNF
jgi:hypothetical protein